MIKSKLVVVHDNVFPKLLLLTRWKNKQYKKYVHVTNYEDIQF